MESYPFLSYRGIENRKLCDKLVNQIELEYNKAYIYSIYSYENSQHDCYRYLLFSVHLQKGEVVG
jgi:ferritin